MARHSGYRLTGVLCSSSLTKISLRILCWWPSASPRHLFRASCAVDSLDPTRSPITIRKREMHLTGMRISSNHVPPACCFEPNHSDHFDHTVTRIAAYLTATSSLICTGLQTHASRSRCMSTNVGFGLLLPPNRPSLIISRNLFLPFLLGNEARLEHACSGVRARLGQTCKVHRVKKGIDF